jgi:hypothetical protein
MLAALVGAYAASRTIGLPLLEPLAEPFDAAGPATQVVQGGGLCAALRLCQAPGDAMSLGLRKEGS